MSCAARIIRDEYRALASVVKSLQFPIQAIQNCNFQWAHMSREENKILSLVEKYPTPQDWRVYK